MIVRKEYWRRKVSPVLVVPGLDRPAGGRRSSGAPAGRPAGAAAASPGFWRGTGAWRPPPGCRSRGPAAHPGSCSPAPPPSGCRSDQRALKHKQISENKKEDT